MPCPEYEERLLESAGGEEVARHLAGCAACREFAEALAEADAALAGALAGIGPSRGFQRAVLQRIAPRPSFIPEVLDFIGWAAMLAACAGLGWMLRFY